MNVIGHQNISVNGAVQLHRGAAQPVQVSGAITVREETRAAIIAALDYMDRAAGKVDARAARHRKIGSESISVRQR
jgi:hypothetical protein